MAAGYGGVSKVNRITGVSRTTITKGIEELKKEITIDGKVRKSGGGPKYVEEKHPDIEERIRKIVDGSTYGNPERVLSYTTESLRKIETELGSQGIAVSYKTVGKILDSMNYSKQGNQKMLQVGEAHSDRNAQFEHINDTAAKYLTAGDPVISVDTKKKENIGNFKNSGQECRRNKEPRKVLDLRFSNKRTRQNFALWSV
jgi:transposase